MQKVFVNLVQLNLFCISFREILNLQKTIHKYMHNNIYTIAKPKQYILTYMYVKKYTN